MSAELPGDYENRDVDYASIHGETEEVFSKFVAALDLKPGERMLDVGGGYGSVLVHILEEHHGLLFHYDLLDNSLRQIKKAKKHIDAYLKKNPSRVNISYIYQSATKMDPPPASYDLIVCKMFIHEVPEHKKQVLFEKIFAALKPGGRLLIWNPDLEEADHLFYVNTIRKKDELAGFNALVNNRHFLTNAALTSSLKQAGFTGIEKLFDFNYDLHTQLRLNAEFKSDPETLRSWHAYILGLAEELNPHLRKDLLISSNSDNIHIRFKRAVFKALKP